MALVATAVNGTAWARRCDGVVLFGAMGATIGWNSQPEGPSK